jgi:hypothetical protein
MSRRILLVVSERFQLADGRLVLAPDFPRVQELDISKLPARAEVITPEGKTVTCEVIICLTHFNNVTDADRRWRYVAELHGISKDDVPVGSSVYVFDELWR